MQPVARAAPRGEKPRDGSVDYLWGWPPLKKQVCCKTVKDARDRRFEGGVAYNSLLGGGVEQLWTIQGGHVKKDGMRQGTSFRISKKRNGVDSRAPAKLRPSQDVRWGGGGGGGGGGGWGGEGWGGLGGGGRGSS